MEITETIVAIRCITCGVLYGIPSDLLEIRKIDGKVFHCVNGHEQHYLDGKSVMDWKVEADEANKKSRTVEITNNKLIHKLEQLEAQINKNNNNDEH